MKEWETFSVPRYGRGITKQEVDVDADRKGLWLALTCVCSLYMFLKTLRIFHNSK